MKTKQTKKTKQPSDSEKTLNVKIPTKTHWNLTKKSIEDNIEIKDLVIKALNSAGF